MSTTLPGEPTTIASLPENSSSQDSLPKPENKERDLLDVPTPKHPPQPPEQAEHSLKLALGAARTAHENRGTNIEVLDLRDVTPMFDYFVVVTGNSRRQLHAISEEIDHYLEDDLNDKRMSIEGYDESRWILLDYGSVVIHLFDEETRQFYAIEDLWTDAVKVPLEWDNETAAE